MDELTTMWLALVPLEVGQLQEAESGGGVVWRRKGAALPGSLPSGAERRPRKLRGPPVDRVPLCRYKSLSSSRRKEAGLPLRIFRIIVRLAS